MNKRKLLWELGIVTTILLILNRLLYHMVHVAFIQKYLSTIVAVLFLYTPIFMLQWKKRPIDFLDHRKQDYFRSLLWTVGAILVVFPPYAVCAHFWMKWVVGYSHFQLAGFPRWFDFTAYHLLLVALPEEFFFRGYIQSALKQVFPTRWKILGIEIGWGFFLTALVFAFAHSVIVLHWWHFSIFFPALLFGYLREKTGTITAPILVHAFSNIFIDWFVRSYF